MDMQTERAVWRRVNGNGGLPAEEALLPERLEALILQERGDAACLRMLANRMGGQGSRAMLQIAASTETRVRELVTLHFLLTGRRLRLQTPPCGRPGDPVEALRAACLRMEQTSRSYERLGEEFSRRAEQFSKYARQSREQSRRLMAQLQNRLSRRA